MTMQLDSGDLRAEDMSLEQLLGLETAYTARGFNLIKKGYLLGLPFAVTGMRFAIPETPEKGPNKGIKQRGYVSVECIAYSETELKRVLAAQRISHYDRETHQTVNPTALEELRVTPEERFVFNDGSTGVRRQVVFMLHTYGYIRVVDSDVNENGKPLDERDPIFDTPWDEWHSIGAQTATIGDLEVPYISRNIGNPRQPLVFRCPRGLRISEYDASGGGKNDAETFYFG